MTTLYVVTNDALAVISQRHGAWHATLGLVGEQTQCVAVDPLRPERVYCGTFASGLWISEDAGASWRHAGTGITHPAIMALAVSALERAGDAGVVWAGTEPSALFRSEDGGHTWQERPTLREIPSAPTWSFPPRPWTSHVRWITPDAHVASRLFVGIELGGVMRSQDAGLSWEDRKPGSQHDSHTLRAHPSAPGHVYEAAGGGYAESRDGGKTWRGDDAGLHHHYLWGLAVSPGDPETLLVSAAHGPGQAHNPHSAESCLYRKTAGAPWRPLHADAGLPEPRGTRSLVLATNDSEPAAFYAAGRDGTLYRSADRGHSWETLPVAWPDGYQVRNVEGLAVVELA